MNEHDKSHDTAQENEYGRELAALLSLLETVDRQITPEHVAKRFRELIDDIGNDGPRGEVALIEEQGRQLESPPITAVVPKLLQAVGETPGATEPMDGWTLTWLSHTAERLIGQAPQVAAKLLREAVAASPAGSARHGLLASRLAEALYRVGETAEAEQVANRTLAQTSDPDLLVDLHWTLAQCRMRAGRFAESLAKLDQALASPGISARHWARLLALTARTHCMHGNLEIAHDVATTALEVASEAGDNWAMGWALHVLTLTTAMQGQETDALPLFDRALTVTQADPALTDLRLLLQINQAVTLGDLDRYDEALAAAKQAQHLADQAGMVNRQGQAHSALGQLLFDSGRWDEAIAEVDTLPEDLKGPIAACCDLGIAAAICLHRGEVAAARLHLAAAVPHAERMENHTIGPLALARSLDREHAGDLSGALAVLAAGLADDTWELDEIEELLADAVRLAVAISDIGTAQAIAQKAAALAEGPDIPHRQATALYCQGLLGHDAARLLEAAERYSKASRPLLAASALEAAAGEFAHADDCGQARAAFTQAEEIYTSLQAAADLTRLHARFSTHGGMHGKHLLASGRDSLTPTEAKTTLREEGGLSNPRIATKLLVS